MNATIQHHLSLLPSSRTVTELQQNLYVDDFLSGCDSEDEICDMIREASDIMSQASMTLAKWGSNSSEVTEVLQRDFADKALDEEFIKVLGMYWLASPDCFTVRCAVLPESVYLTKRVVLSLFSRLFDPLGFAAPRNAGQVLVSRAVEVGPAVGSGDSSRVSDTVFEMD